MSLLREIRQQSRSVRVFMFALSLMTTLALVGVVWVSSFERNIYALLNTPTPDANADQVTAAPEDSSKSPLTYLKDALRGTANSFFGLLSGGDEEDSKSKDTAPQVTRPYSFPISDDR